MKVLILTSGGDAPGMNKVISVLYKKFKENLYACKEGFKGLINNEICKVEVFEPKRYENEAGSCIKCSRCPEFKTKKYFNKALENAKQFDYVVVLGGNGSFKGCNDLTQNGVKTVFIPSTIDNDVEISDYSQGFDTAVNACVSYIKNTMPTIEAFKRCCIFEVMGRNCDKIAKEVQKYVCCDLIISNENDINYKEIADIINGNYKKGNATSIIIKERIIDINVFISNLKQYSPQVEIRGAIVGYLQRGTKPTEKELFYAKNFAKKAIGIIKENKRSGAIIFKNNCFQII